MNRRPLTQADQASHWRMIERIATGHLGQALQITFLDDRNATCRIDGQQFFGVDLASAVEMCADSQRCRSCPPSAARDTMSSISDPKGDRR